MVRDVSTKIDPLRDILRTLSAGWEINKRGEDILQKQCLVLHFQKKNGCGGTYLETSRISTMELFCENS